MSSVAFPAASEAVFAWTQQRSDYRRRAGLARRTSSRASDSTDLDLAGNDYLALARHPQVIAAAVDAARRWGTGATASRLVTGTTDLHEELEAELAAFCEVDAALVFSSGYTANLAAITALTGPGTLVVADSHIHASLVDGCRLSRGQVVMAPHRDTAAIARALSEPPAGTSRSLVVTDSIFSVDGEAARLADLIDVCRRHGAGLLIDDAHGLGVTGPAGAGEVVAAGLAGAPDVVVTATLSKALGAQGGVILGPGRVVAHVLETARTFIFDTALAPPSAAAALAALRLLRQDPARPARATANARELHARLRQIELLPSAPDAAILALPAPSPSAATSWAAQCRSGGLAVGCFRPPSVPDNLSRIRLTTHSDLTGEHLDRAVDTLAATAPLVG